MKVSLQSLSRWVDVGTDVAALSHALTMAGLEIEGQSRAAPPMAGIVVAEVRAAEKHPDAEKLSVCRVFDGQQELQIVCGAGNVRAGIKVPLATVGATMPGGLIIKKAKLRGVESFGMLCSAKELGLAEDSQGLLELPPDLSVGQDIVAALGLDDEILEINLTPNRGDCMSVLGVAREIAAYRGEMLSVPPQPAVAATIKDVFPVTIASAGCGKFVSRVIRGVRPGAPSPWWLQERLRRAGLRSINAVVDITNYVLLELGQPMHAYDLGKLQGGITVRHAAQDESLTLLDGRAIKLDQDMLVIADDRQVLGLAGIMGGLDTAISDATTDLLLEVAYFQPDAIAGRGRRFGLVTDSSQRFERGVDFNLQERAMELATELVLAHAGGQAGPLQVVGAPAVSRPVIELRHGRVTKVLGHEIAAQDVVRILSSLGMKVDSGNAEGAWRVTPPSWRFDLAIEVDLIEEIARVYGYERIPAIRASGPAQLGAVTESRVARERLALALVDRGYQEAITYSFTDPNFQRGLHPGVQALALANPISAELGVMRLSLWSGLLQAALHNQRHQQPLVRLFELGRCFSADGHTEKLVLAGVAGGLLVSKQWAVPTTPVDFFDVKADIEALLALSGKSADFSFEAQPHPALHPGQSARILRQGQPVGWLGCIHPVVNRQLDLVYPVVLFELDVDSCFDAQVPEYKEISRFPAVRRDLSLIVDSAVQYATIAAAVQESAGPLLKDLRVFDVYQGAGMEKGKKSIALGMNLQDTSRTLTDAEIDAAVTHVVEHLALRLGARLRDK